MKSGADRHVDAELGGVSAGAAFVGEDLVRRRSGGSVANAAHFVTIANHIRLSKKLSLVEVDKSGKRYSESNFFVFAISTIFSSSGISFDDRPNEQ